jgi:glycosyltransferase involved in cell wall biosynthesis
MWQNKHIVIVGPAHPLRGGLATYNERLARELQQHNKVTLLTFSLQYPNFLFPGETQYSSDAKPTDLDIDVAINSVNPLNWIKVGQKYKKIKPDVVIFRYWMPFFGPCFGTISRIIKQNKQTKILAITDNIIPHEKHFYDSPFSAYFLNSLHGAVTMSKKVLEDLKTHFPKTKAAKNVAYHAHPLYDNFGEKPTRQTACSKLNLDPTKRYILFFGFIRKYKGLDLLLEAMAIVKESHPDIHLLVAGEFYEDKQPYLEQIKSLQIEAFLEMHTHFIPNDDVGLYFAASDIVVQPYRNATQSGVSQIAYHFEIPMIITNVGGLAELVPHGKAGYVCEPNVESLAAAIVEMYDQDVFENMKAEIKILKQQFSWESMCLTLSDR